MFEKLTKDEIIKLLKMYDEYIQYANEECLYNHGWKPICIEEFYLNEYMEDSCIED